MGKPTGFMDYQRVDVVDVPAGQRVKDFEFFHGKLAPQERKEQAGRCMDCGVPFCQAGLMMDGKLIGCPLRNLIPEWNDMLWNGSLPLALERLLRTNVFPEFTGYVCPAPCEDACSCAKVSRPVSINANERSIIESAFDQRLVEACPPEHRSGNTVAVIGSGPAGLTVAALLNRRGHTVTVFERSKTPGGLLTYGIPSMKLPKTVVARRVQLLKDEGIEFKCGVDVGRDESLEQLAASYDAVVLAIGAGEPRRVEFDGTATQVCFALDYLSAVAAEQLGEAELEQRFDADGKTVAIVGAGDSANDCIATALRQGAFDVIQLIRRPASDYAPMADYAHQEAFAVFDHDIRRFATKVAAVHADDAGNLTELVLAAPEGEVTVPCDMLLIASGFKGAEGYVTDGCALGEEDGVFQAGDMALGSTLVVRAMAHAYEIARKVDTYLMGYSNII